MKYTVRIKYDNGNAFTWETSDRNTAFFILTTEMKRYEKHIIFAFIKGVKI